MYKHNKSQNEKLQKAYINIIFKLISKPQKYYILFIDMSNIVKV